MQNGKTKGYNRMQARIIFYKFKPAGSQSWNNTWIQIFMRTVVDLMEMSSCIFCPSNEAISHNCLVIVPVL